MIYPYIYIPHNDDTSHTVNVNKYVGCHVTTIMGSRDLAVLSFDDSMVIVSDSSFDADWVEFNQQKRGEQKS